MWGSVILFNLLYPSCKKRLKDSKLSFAISFCFTDGVTYLKSPAGLSLSCHVEVCFRHPEQVQLWWRYVETFLQLWFGIFRYHMWYRHCFWENTYADGDERVVVLQNWWNVWAAQDWTVQYYSNAYHERWFTLRYAKEHTACRWFSVAAGVDLTSRIAELLKGGKRN